MWRGNEDEDKEGFSCWIIVVCANSKMGTKISGRKISENRNSLMMVKITEIV